MSYSFLINQNNQFIQFRTITKYSIIYLFLNIFILNFTRVKSHLINFAEGGEFDPHSFQIDNITNLYSNLQLNYIITL